jgi:hypothetical protein
MTDLGEVFGWTLLGYPVLLASVKRQKAKYAKPRREVTAT